MTDERFEQVTARYGDNKTTVDLGLSPIGWQEAESWIEGGNLYGISSEKEGFWDNRSEEVLYWKADGKLGEIAAQAYNKDIVGTTGLIGG